MVGEGTLVILASVSSLGGSSKHLAAVLGLDELVAQARGLPGASSQWNGTEAEAWIGGVSMPGGSEGLLGSEYRESLGVDFGAASTSDPI